MSSQRISRLWKKRCGKMPMMNCGQKREKAVDLEDLPKTKRAKELSKTNDGSTDFADLQKENEDLRRQLESTQNTNLQQLNKGYRLTGNKNRDGEILTMNLAATQSLPLDFGGENDKQILMEKLHSCMSDLNKRDLQIERLENDANEAQQVRLELESRMGKMQQQLCKELEHGGGSYADGAATPFLLESSLKAMQNSAASFTKLFLEYIEKHTSDARSTFTNHFENIYLTRPGHVTYLLNALIFEILFKDFENESFSCGGTSVFLDQTEPRSHFFAYFQLLENTGPNFDLGPDDRFEKFRRQKLGDILSQWPSSDKVTAGNLSIDALENPGAEEDKVRLMDSFRSVAKGVWTLHKLSFSFQTPAKIVRVSQQEDLNAEYMDSVVSVQDDERLSLRWGL